MNLPHADLVTGIHVRVIGDVPDTTQTGPKGGLRVPLRVVWRPHGTGLFTMVRRTPDGSQTVLFPYVEFTNGRSERRRYEPVELWMRACSQ